MFLSDIPYKVFTLITFFCKNILHSLSKIL